MSSMPNVRAAAFLLAVMLGCAKSKDPRHLDLADFNSGATLTDTLKRLIPPGTRVLAASEMMQSNGFRCGERGGIKVDTATKKLGSGPPYLECWQSTRVDMGLKHRDWTVQFAYDTTGVRDVVAGYIIQP